MQANYKQVLDKEKDASFFIPYSSQVTKDTIKLYSGDYIQTIRLQGAAHESADIQDLNDWHDTLNNMMRTIASPKVAIWTHIVRRQYQEYPEGDFTNSFVKELNEKYKESVGKQTMLINELYVTVVYRPEPVKVNRFLDNLFKKDKEDEAVKQREEILAINNITSTVVAALDRYEPELLTNYVHNNVVFSETLEFLSFLVNGKWQRFPVVRSPINEVLSTKRPMFGKGGVMAFHTPTQTDYALALDITEYPNPTQPGLLNILLSMEFEFVLSQSFTFLTKPVAVSRMKRAQGKMVNAGDVAESQIEAIYDAMDDVSSGRYALGVHSLSLLVRAKDVKSLDNFTTQAMAAMGEIGIITAPEDNGLTGAFYAQLPGNFEYRVRVADITSRNFMGFSSFHNFPIGHIRGNQWGNAVTMFKTTSGAPFYFNFHKGEQGLQARLQAKIDPNHKDLANTIVIGQSGAGKTVLEMFMLAQLMKFNQPENGKRLTAVLFDKDLGASIGVRAMGGRYYAIKNGVPSGFNPFQMENTPSNITFLEKLIKQLVKREDSPLTATQEFQISKAIRGVMSVAKEKRHIGALLEFLDSTEKEGIHLRLKKWCKGGSNGWLFDNPVDTLDIDNTPILGFDVTEFLENPETRTPTVLYLMHRVESLFDGRRVPIFMDEFGKLIDDEAFEDLSKNKLVTIRKQDGFLVMFTQSPKQVIQQKIAYAIIEQTATKIFLPNPSADRKDYIEGFKLTEAEYQIVKELGEKSRRFLIKQGHNSVVAELNLRGFDDELAVLSGNTATSLLVEKLVEKHGENPDVWLPEFHKIRNGE